MFSLWEGCGEDKDEEEVENEFCWEWRLSIVETEEKFNSAEVGVESILLEFLSTEVDELSLFSPTIIRDCRRFEEFPTSKVTLLLLELKFFKSFESGTGSW